MIRTSDLSGEQLWLLDEGHCFRDQLVRFCQLKAAKASQMAYHLGSMETFMRMVEGEEGLPLFRDWPCCSSVRQQKELVHAFAIPCPTRQLILLTHKDFVRQTLKETLVREIRRAVPSEMQELHSTQVLV